MTEAQTESDYRKQVLELRQQAARMEYCQAQVDLLSEAAQLADLHNDTLLGWAVRQKLLASAAFTDNHDVLLVAFSWCLGVSDREPERYPIRELLWSYKWVIGGMAQFPGITADRLEGLMDDFARRMQLIGASPRTVEYLRMTLAADMGRWSEVERWMPTWELHSRDRWSDCHACEINRQVSILGKLGRHEQALAVAKPLLDGQLTCRSVPQGTSGHVLISLFETGQYERGLALHQRWYPRIRNNRDFLDTVAMHFEFLALTGNLTRALNGLQRHLHWAMETCDWAMRARYYTAGVVTVARLKHLGRKDVRFRLPREDPQYSADGRMDVAACAAWFRAGALQIADALDTRNGNQEFRQRLAEREARAARGVDVPITPRKTAPTAESNRTTATDNDPAEASDERAP